MQYFQHGTPERKNQSIYIYLKLLNKNETAI